MGINSEYSCDYYFDDDWYLPGEEELEAISPYEDWTREDFEDLYSTELLNMWFLIREEFPRKSYQSFCDFCLDPPSTEDLNVPPEFVVSLWESLNHEAHFLLEDKTVHNFFVYLYK
jgi:hypothetical protein